MKILLYSGNGFTINRDRNTITLKAPAGVNEDFMTFIENILKDAMAHKETFDYLAEALEGEKNG